MQTVVVILFCFRKPVKNEQCMILFLLENSYIRTSCSAFLYANIIRHNVKHVQMRTSLHGGFAILTIKTQKKGSCLDLDLRCNARLQSKSETQLESRKDRLSSADLRSFQSEGPEITHTSPRIPYPTGRIHVSSDQL